MIEPNVNGVITQKLNVKLEKNSKGYNWEITVTNADNIQDAMNVIQETDQILRHEYGEQS